MRFWSGQTVSQFGNQFTLLALPTIAILVLHASVFQIGLLGSIEFLAFPAIGLFVGVWVDRFARKPILIACNLGRLFSLSSLPPRAAALVAKRPQVLPVKKQQQSAKKKAKKNQKKNQ